MCGVYVYALLPFFVGFHLLANILLSMVVWNLFMSNVD
jgi:hypothetical protein